MMERLCKYEVKVGGKVRPLIMDQGSTDKEILAILRKNNIFSGRKADISGSVADVLYVDTLTSVIEIKYVSG